jgi:hypothetical protein
MNKPTTIVSLLYDRTQTQLITWERTADDEKFQTSFTTYSVEVYKQPNHSDDGREYIATKLNIVDELGAIVEVIEAKDLSMRDLGGHDPEAVLEQIYDMARRIALGVEQAYDKLIKDLENILPF